MVACRNIPSLLLRLLVLSLLLLGCDQTTDIPELTDTPGTEAPAAPTELTATAASSATIELSWTDNAATETGYVIERSSTSGTSGFSLVDTVDANAESYTDDGLLPDTAYWYRVCATVSDTPSSYSNVAAATTEAVAATTPVAPSSLSATATSDTVISLGWSDNSDNETGFRVFRSSTSSSSDFNEINTVGVDAVSYSDDGLSGGTQYWYRVRAYNAEGDSGDSDTATATTEETVLFSEDFDTDFLSRWLVTGSFLDHYSTSVFWTTPGADDSYGCFRLRGGYLNSILDGEHSYTVVDSSGVQPTYVQVYVKATYNNLNGGNFLLAGDGASLWAFFDSYADIYLHCDGQEVLVRDNYSTNHWHKLEFKNINWITKTYDFYVDGTSQKMSAKFSNTSATKAQQIWVWNDDSSPSCDFCYDEILIR